MGQGAYTGIATIVAEELDADWSNVRVESAPADATRYANLAFGKMQGTGGSSAMANSWMQLREAGAPKCAERCPQLDATGATGQLRTTGRRPGGLVPVKIRG